MCLRIVLPVLLGLALPVPAHAWHRDGHHSIARLAWKQLDERQQLRVSRILKAHPHYQVYLAEGRPKDIGSEMEWVFLQASTWSDWVRGPTGTGLDPEKRQEIRKQFNKPVWHYVNLPYVHPSDVDRFDAAAIRKEILFPAFDARGEPRHVLAALEWSMKQLQAPETPEPDRAVALCWLFHLVGDLHQPLHGTSLIASRETFDPPFDPPHGDLGGNRLVVRRTTEDARAVNLHFYWDQVLFNDEPGFAGVEAMAAKLRNDPKLQREQLPELKATSFLAWAEESLTLARAAVYNGKDGFIKARALPVRKGDANDLDVPVLPEGYRATAECIARRRMAVAGYRLADQLQQALTGPR